MSGAINPCLLWAFIFLSWAPVNLLNPLENKVTAQQVRAVGIVSMLKICRRLPLSHVRFAPCIRRALVSHEKEPSAAWSITIFAVHNTTNKQAVDDKIVLL